MLKLTGWSSQAKCIFFVILFLAVFQVFNACGPGDHMSAGIDNTASSVHEGDTDVSTSQSFSVHFTAPIKTETVTTQSFFIVRGENNLLNESVSSAFSPRLVCDPKSALEATVTCISETDCTLTPDSPLEKGTDYVLCLTREIEFTQPEIYGVFKGKSIHFTTSSAVLESLTLSPTDVSLEVDGTQQFALMGTYDNETTSLLNIGLLWTSSDNSLISISQSGLATALAEGEVTVTVTETTTQLQASVIITVSPASGGVSYYTVGGHISGLDGDTVILQNNSGQDLTLTTDGDFTFDASVIDGESYDVTVLTHPTGKLCAISNESGTVNGANITDVIVTCSANNYTVGGLVSGLTGTVVLQNNGGDNQSISTNGSFTFSTPVNHGGAYAVTILTQPIGQTCILANASGTMSAAHVTNVSITCINNSYTVGGTVSGLTGTVVLQNNAGDDQTINANGAYTFSTSVAYNAAYAVTVLTQPTGQTCVVSNGSSTMGAANVTNVNVTCTTNTYSVGGTVSGLTGTVVLQNNAGDNLSLSSNGSFTFNTPIADSNVYAVTVLTQPSGQVCTVTNGSGTINAAAVANVSIQCEAAIILFHTTGPTFGQAIGSRSNADSLCSNSVAGAGLSCANVHAFLSVDGSDEIRDMPANYNVPTNLTIRASTSTIIANDWADLLDGSIQTSLATAMGHSLPNANFWWSGSTSGGALNSACSGWTVGFQNGTIGSGSETDSNWMSQFNSSCNGDNLTLLCLCY